MVVPGVSAPGQGRSAPFSPKMYSAASVLKMTSSKALAESISMLATR